MGITARFEEAGRCQLQEPFRLQFSPEVNRRRRKKSNDTKTTTAGVFMHRQMMPVPVAVALWSRY
jgi:hypothetical protein